MIEENKIARRFTISRKSATNNAAEEWAETILGTFDTYEEAYAAGRKYLDENRNKKVLFLQKTAEGRLEKQYTLKRSPIHGGDGTIAGEIEEIESIERHRKRKAARKKAYLRSKAEGIPFEEALRQVHEEEREEKRQANRQAEKGE